MMVPLAERMFQDYAAKNNFPAIAYGIVADQKLIFAGAKGAINLKSKTQATTKSLFRIASMTKSFTAMAILKLRDEGRLQLSDPVSKHIVEMKEIVYLTEDSPEITILNLLTMSAGFPEDNPWGDRQLADTPEELISFIKGGITFSNSPSKEFEYSNMGYAMLGRIISTVSGTSYQQYITDNILKPLGMDDTRWEYADVDPSLLAIGYRFEGGEWIEEALLHDGIYGAMGGLITSIEDFSKYVSLHLSASPPRNGRDEGPLRRSSLREMHKPWQFRSLEVNPGAQDDNPCPTTAGYGYGLGWRKDCLGRERVSHSGGLPGFGSDFRFYPEYGIGIICFANLTYAPAGDVNARIIDTLIMKTGLKPRSIQISDTLQVRKDQIIKLLTSWDQPLEKKILAENFYLDRAREQWIKKAAEIFEGTGHITNVEGIVPFNELRGRFIMHGERQDAVVFFTLTPERSPKVQQLELYLEPKAELKTP